jgi:hypothetical protein
VKRTLKAGWQKWKAFGERVGNIQARIALTVFYWTFMAPVGLWQTFVADRLGVRRPEGGTSWRERSTADRGLEDARRQF